MWQAAVAGTAEHGPGASRWLEARLDAFAARYNLSQVVRDFRTLSASMQPAKPCSPAERRSLVAAASAHARLPPAQERRRAAEAQVREREAALDSSTEAWEAARGSGGSGKGPEAALARREAEAAEAAVHHAECGLERCAALSGECDAPQTGLVPGSVGLGQSDGSAVGRRLQAAAASVAAGDARAGWEHLQGAAQDGAAAVRGALGSGALAQLARAVFSGGLAIARLALGVMRGAVQVTVFAAMLFYLLDAEEDPLAAAAGLLPLSAAAQARVTGVLAGTVRGVLGSALLLSGFHAGFTWLTLRTFGAPLGFGVRAAALLAAHVTAAAYADDVILRGIPGSNPYVTGLGVVGGLPDEV
ncbi:hypothetical protein WJX81_001595 [Elliptochloris bilobata]|uniref:Uncharacterized protein n=1 Tax=Elliptochloris bilobata TaxID=381761 RepID=A0AAW1QV46_9CHLO